MIVLFTDFGMAGPYVGQMKAVLHRKAPGIPVVDLFADVPPFDPMLAAYLLPAYAEEFPPGTVFLCVVDPGVGSDRAPLTLMADGRWYVGPDNGLFAIVGRRALTAYWREIGRAEPRLSASFHGRDLFAPAAAGLAGGQLPKGHDIDPPATGKDWPDDLARVVYVDHFGNAMTGIRAAALTEKTVIEAGGRRLVRRRTFSDVPPGETFWYENANGLAEIAVNQGRAATDLGLTPGSPVVVSD